MRNRLPAMEAAVFRFENRLQAFEDKLVQYYEDFEKLESVIDSDIEWIKEKIRVMEGVLTSNL